MDSLISYIKENKIGDYKENVSFKTLTTYRTGGNARIVVFPNSVLNLKLLLKYLKDNNIKFKVFGNGSNILASDKDYDGVIIKLTMLNKCKISLNRIYIEAGVNLMAISNKLCKEGYSGFEFTCGIPGTVGGAIYMNAGAYLKDISNILISTQVLDLNDLKIKTFYNKKLNFQYRHSFFQDNDNYIILSGKFKIERGNIEEIMNLIVERKQRRVETQPLEYPSAGSVFRNPLENYAGKLIENCGLKGYQKGGAEISKKHANFIVNKENATSEDIKYLMDLAHDTVKEKYDVDLIREQELFNWE